MVFVIFKKKNELINGNEYLKEFIVILKNKKLFSVLRLV